MNRRDIELLSSYLDGQLKPSDSARLEARLSLEPELRSILSDLRSTRGLLRQLPMRKAPRNFTLTPKMVGKNPPLPRTYPAFRFVTTIATLLLFFSLGLNFLAPQLASQSPAFGMGGGGAPEVFSAQAPEATEAPAPAGDAFATESPAMEAPAPAAEPPAELAPQPTTSSEESTTTREAESAVEKEGETGNAVAQDQPVVPSRPPVPPTWQILLAGIALLSGLVMLLMRQSAAARWRRK